MWKLVHIHATSWNGQNFCSIVKTIEHPGVITPGKTPPTLVPAPGHDISHHTCITCRVSQSWRGRGLFDVGVAYPRVMLTWSQQFRHRARWWVSDPDLVATRILNLDICVDSYATRPWSGPCVSSPGDDHNHITWAAAGHLTLTI